MDLEQALVTVQGRRAEVNQARQPIAGEVSKANLAGGWVEPFLQRYGIAADPGRLSFYRLLDEFF